MLLLACWLVSFAHLKDKSKLSDLIIEVKELEESEGVKIQN